MLNKKVVKSFIIENWLQIALAVLALFLAVVELTFHNKVANFIEKQIYVQTKKLGLDVTFESLDYGYFPPNISLENVSFKDKDVLVAVNKVQLSLSILPLIKGQVKAGHLYIDNLNGSLDISNPKPSTKAKFEFDLETLTRLIPIEHILVSDSKLIILKNKDVFSFDLDFLEFEKLFGKLQVEIKSNVDIRTQKYKEDFLLNTKVRWQKKGFFVSFFTLQKKNSILQLSGFLKKQIFEAKKITMSLFYENITELRFSVNAELTEFNQFLIELISPEIRKKSTIKEFTGRLQASVYYFPDSIDGIFNDKGSIKIKADDLKSPFVSLKEIDFEGELGTQALKSEKFKLQLKNQSSISFENLILEKKKSQYLISVDLKADQIHIEDVIEALNLEADSLRIPVGIDAHCGGTLHKNLLIKCNGSGSVKSFDILNSKDGSKLISTRNIRSNFSANIRKGDLNFETELSYKDKVSNLETKADLSGSLDYIKGFDLIFESNDLDLNFINTISGLKFAGRTSLKGSTKGSSKWGTFNAKLNNKDFKLNKFFLGSSIADISYEFPLLNVKNVEGSILEYQNSYTGDFALNIERDSIDMDFLAQDISDNGLRVLFYDQFKLPADIKFQSNAIIQASGSTDINQMDLNLKTKLTGLDFFGEKFESGTIELSGTDGDWSLKKGELSKKKASIEARGSFKGLETMNLRLISKAMTFEDSTFIKNLGVKLIGPVDLILNAKGPIEGPEAVGTLVAINTLSPSKLPLGDSNIGYRLFENELFFKGEVFANSFNGEGFYPLESGGKLSLNGSFKNFDTLNFLNFNSENTKNTHLYLNGDANFSKDKAGAFFGELENFKVDLNTDQQNLLKIAQTGNGDFKNPIFFKTVQENDEASLNFDFSNSNEKKISFSGSLDISFLQPLIPTCETINGKFASDSLSWSQLKNKTISSGSAKVDSASFKSDAFPYSFNKINAKLKTNNDKIYISELVAFLSNTKIFGSGQIQTTSPASIDLNLNYKNLNLEFPKKIFTTTDGVFKLSGSSIPLDISGNLIIREGVFADEILSSGGAQTVMPNKRLPCEILRSLIPSADLKNVKILIQDQMKVSNTEADGYVSGQLIANGNPADPVIRGNLKLKPSFKINFQDNTFSVKEGLINYKNKTVDSPELFIDALTAIRDNNDPLEKTYSVRMLASGSPTDLDIDFTSQPALDDKQIVSLLTIGTVSTQSLGQEINAQEQAAYSGFQFGSYLLQRNKAIKDLKKETGIEIGVSSSLTSFGVSPKVEAKKGWTPKLSSSLSQSFGNQRNLEFKNEYKLNKKTSTILGIQNNQTNDAAQLNNRRVRQGIILDLGLQYKFEFD